MFQEENGRGPVVATYVSDGGEVEFHYQGKWLKADNVYPNSCRLTLIEKEESANKQLAKVSRSPASAP